MSFLRKLSVTGGVAAATLALSLAGALPASAATTVSATSPNDQGYGKTSIGFSSDGYARWDSIYVNDRCNPNTPGEGDGYRARMDLYIYQYGRTILVGSREDVGGCTSDPYTGDAHWASGGPISRAGMRICSGTCSRIKWVYNPYAA